VPILTITVNRRTDDYHAHFKGDRRLWGCGKSPMEAIGDVVLSHAYLIGVAIESN